VTATATRVIRLLVVDQSPAARERLRRLFDDVPDIDVVGEAGTVDKALRLFEEALPTTVVVDCDLPDPGSFAAVHEMMSLYRIPIVMLTKRDKDSLPALEAQALQAGAVALAPWSTGDTSAGRDSRENLIRTVRAMSEVKVVRRRGQGLKAVPAPDATATVKTATTNATPAPLLPFVGERIEIVAIGASTGGPPVLQTILGGLSRRLPVPIVLVQHLSRGFQKSLVSWLSESTGTHIVVGEQGMPLDAGLIYLAPDDRHMVLDGSGHIVLNDDPPENGSRPSVSVLFRSVAQQYGPRAIGILLTGMGRDGAKELRLMRDRGAITIAQDEETSVVHGMPGEAIKLKGARFVLPPERVASVVEHHLQGSSNGRRASAAPCR
jgi:two-component system, chemotaxis family, protein-glutamate methylesterase/glutaminase